MEHLLAIARQFIPRGIIAEVREYGHGNVNDTFLVTVAPPPPAERPRQHRRFILQRLNTEVFQQPELVMANLAAVTGHLRRRLATQPLGPGRPLRCPASSLRPAGRDHVLDGAGSFWRALSFIDRAGP